jgi:hypothetical protein
MSCNACATATQFSVNVTRSSGAVTITAASWSANVVTFTIGAHSYLVGQSIVVSGMAPAGYNGTFVISAVTGTTVSAVLVGSPGASTVRGTLEVFGVGQVLNFSVAADACCMLTECKMIQSVLVDAICQYISANVANFPASDAAQISDRCCGCSDYEHMVWQFASKKVSWRLVGSAASLPTSPSVIAVTAPYAPVNT